MTALDRALVAGDAGRVTGEEQERPDPEVPEKARRRTFTAQYKLDVVAEYDAAPAGEKGAVLRREGLYSSHVTEWRRARDTGALAGPARPRGRPAADPRDAQIARLQKEKAKLEQELAKARFVVDVQAKLQAPLGDHLRERGYRARAEHVTDQAIAVMAPMIGTRAACAAAGVPQATWYRRHRISPLAPKPAPVPHAGRVQPRALAPAERQAILDALHSDRFADLAPDEIWATLLDEGIYLGSVSTYYRVLREAGESRERRAQATHPAAVKPELIAAGPNQVYSWDITKLHGPARWTYYHLYVILDIYSRYVVGWMVATCESAALAEKLIAATCAKQGITRGQLSIHADRGSSMTSKPVALLLADLGITQSHSRPHVSNDNPYSEAQFKTLKYRPGFPARFASIQAARAHCQDFFPWYNNEHHHGGLGLHTAADVHHGRAAAVRAGRAQTLTAAYHAHPERFVRKPPAPPKLPGTSWINPPQEKETGTQ
ncbi:MAG TPA: IS3 family transposase [Streptosporangiaceae bacterium]|nr:IS3 family transposase [Streptosporangiaceae bacterium]